MRPLRRFSFPVPLSHAIALAAISTISVVLVGLKVENWAYVSLSHLSGIPRESILFAGPISAGFACYFAGGLFESRSPASSAAAQRRSSAMVSVFAAAYAGSAVVGQFLGTVFLIAMYAPRARAGQINWLELTLGPLQLLPLVLIGVILALGGNRWWLPPVATLGSIAWAMILPILLGGLLPRYTYSTGHEFLFPATPAYRHEPYSTIPIFVVILFWVSVSWLLVTTLHLGARRQGGLSLPISRAAIAFVAVTGTFAWVAIDGARFYKSFEVAEAECDRRDGWTYCVMPEEADLLHDFVVETSFVRARSGALGMSPTTVISSGLSVADWKVPTGVDRVIEANISDVYGIQDVRNDVAGDLAGLGECEIGGLLEGSALAAVGLAQWLAGDAYYIASSEFAQYVDDLSGTEREVWLMENAQTIESCSIDYEG